MRGRETENKPTKNLRQTLKFTRWCGPEPIIIKKDRLVDPEEKASSPHSGRAKRTFLSLMMLITLGPRATRGLFCALVLVRSDLNSFSLQLLLNSNGTIFTDEVASSVAIVGGARKEVYGHQLDRLHRTHSLAQTSLFVLREKNCCIASLASLSTMLL